jgi:hypothetical protein
MTFDEAWAEGAIASLSARGETMAPGLTSRELDAIGEAFGVEVPHEYALLLSAGTPTSPRWVQWSDGPDAVADEARRWIDQRFAFDIEHNGYWSPLFGPRPPRTAEAVDRALAFLATAPVLIPVYGHRFLTTGAAPRAVLSVWQAVDTIYYGYDLADYLARELDVPRPTWAASDPPPVPIWEDLFDL